MYTKYLEWNEAFLIVIRRIMIVHLQTNPPYNSTKEKSEENKKKRDEYDSESYQYKYI